MVPAQPAARARAGAARRRPPLLALRAGGDAHNPEAEVDVAEAGIVPVAESGAAGEAITDPRPAAQHTIAPILRTLWILSGALVVVVLVVPILAPFVDV